MTPTVLLFNYCGVLLSMTLTDLVFLQKPYIVKTDTVTIYKTVTVTHTIYILSIEIKTIILRISNQAFSLYSPYYAEACNELKQCPSLRHSAKATQLLQLMLKRWRIVCNAE